MRIACVDGLPVCWDEIRTECETDLEEEVLRQDVREGIHNIGVMLDLAKAGFDVIGMDHDVIVQVCDVKIVCTDDYVLLPCGVNVMELTGTESQWYH
jgi:molybdenum cofactor biosynthesis enzyme